MVKSFNLVLKKKNQLCSTFLPYGTFSFLKWDFQKSFLAKVGFLVNGRTDVEVI